MMDEIQSSDIPRELGIEDDNRERYNELTDPDSDSPFAGQQMSKVFMFSLGVGHDQGLRKSLDSRAGSIPWTALSDDEEWVVKSVAVKEAEIVDILKDGNQIAKIAEEYANGGFDYIDDVIRGPKDTLSTFRTEVVKMHKDQVEGAAERIKSGDD